MPITNVDVNGLNLIREQEGRALRAYQDPVGVWTIGYGITNMDKGIGFKVGPGVTITADQAEYLLFMSITRNYVPDVLRVLDQSKLAHPQGAVNGGASFHYNTGGILKSSWPRLLNAGQIGPAKVNFESWDRAGGRVLADLVQRRATEWIVITEEQYGHMTGPETENDRGRPTGHTTLLTALPTNPALAAPATPVSGTVATTGIPDPVTTPPGVLSEGSTGPAVLALQEALTAAGVQVHATGTFDTATTAAVETFQAAHPQLTTDGKVGPATRAALARAGDIRAKANNVARTAVTGSAASAGLWHWVSADIGEALLIASGIGVTVALGILAWKYRNDIEAIVNKAIGRVVI